MSTLHPLFSISNGSFSYRNTNVLEDLNITIEAGHFYGLIGPNGSGKTTLLDLLMGALTLKEGELNFNNKPLENYDPQELAQQIALVPQDFTMGFSYSVFDIVLMGRHPHIPRFSNPSQEDFDIVEDVLKTLDISHLRTRPVTDLSGGERQRVVVARALAQKTGILVLDEATSNLDIQHTIEIMRVIKKGVTEKKTTVIAAIHDLNMAAAYCDELIVLKDRSVHTMGRVASVLTPELLSDVFSVQGTVHLNKNTGKPSINYNLL